MKEDMIAILKRNSAYSIQPTLRNAQAKAHIVYGGKDQTTIRLSA